MNFKMNFFYYIVITFLIFKLKNLEEYDILCGHHLTSFYIHKFKKTCPFI